MTTELIRKSKQYFKGFISLIYPHSCVTCGKEMNDQNQHFCFLCEQNLHFTSFEKYEEYSVADEVFWGRLNIENVYALLYYENGNSTKEILHHIKYKEGKDLGHFMGKMIGERLKNHPKYTNIDALVPIPVHSKKEFSRGYNQSLLIAKGMSETLEIPIVDALYRKTHDESQTRKSKEERYRNVKGKFGLKEGALAAYQHVLIVDDVLTTGSTLEFASRAVMESGEVKVSLATVAVAR